MASTVAMPAVGSGAGDFYRSLADELTGLAKKGSEITWTSDVQPRSHRMQSRSSRQPAPTGRLPAGRAHAPPVSANSTAKLASAPAKPNSTTSRRPLLQEAAVAPRPPTKAPPMAVGVEVSARKPTYLAEVKTRPTVVKAARRGAQPRSQGFAQLNPSQRDAGFAQRSRARRLRLSSAASQPRVDSAPLASDPLDESGAESDVIRLAIETRAEGATADVQEDRASSPGASSAAAFRHLRIASPGAASAGTISLGRSARASSPKASCADGMSIARSARESSPRAAAVGIMGRPVHRSASSPGAASMGVFSSLARSGRPRALSSSASAASALDADLMQYVHRSVSASSSAQADDEVAVQTKHSALVATPPPPKARLTSVMDLQLILPEAAGMGVSIDEDLQPAYKAQSIVQTPVAASASLAHSETPPKSTQHAPFVRPVLRGLIADVINEEMRAPELKPADVSCGIEVTPPFAAWRHRRPKAAPIDEDIFGNRIGKPPPPYEDAPPPPYQVAQDTGPKKKDNLLEAQIQALSQVQAQAQAQVQSLAVAQAQVQAHRDEALQLAREVQQHAGDAQRRLAETAEQQAASLQRGAVALQQQLADMVRQELRRDSAGTEQQLAVAMQQSAASVQAALLAATPRAETIPMTDMQNMLDGLRRLESRFEQQWTQAMRAQNAERSAHMEALRSLQRPPPSVQAIMPLPPQQPQPPQVVTADVAAQVSLEEEIPPVEVADVEAQASLGPSQEHEARVARFTEYLLHGPQGQREPPRGGLAPPLTVWPLPTGLAEIDGMFGEASGGPSLPTLSPPEDSIDMDSTLPVSSSGLEDLSLGEIPPVARSPVSRRRSQMSSGELTPSAPSLGEIPSGAPSPGQLPCLSEGEVVSAAFSAGEVSYLSDIPSSGEVTSSEIITAEKLQPVENTAPEDCLVQEWAAENLEPGEVLAAALAASTFSEGEVVGDEEVEHLVSPSLSSGEVPSLHPLGHQSESPASGSAPESLSSRGQV